MAESRRIRVSVVYAEAGRVFERVLRLPPDATVAEAIEAAQIRESRPDIEIHPGRIGIFARSAEFDTRLRDGDRVEIYRPLKIDPKEGRRLRARMQSVNKRE
ncbi:MAG TPA: RnfH family protein [Rhodanobacteraceae bacterium]|jgi:putative ubiquitin-RnfH superfamily antitoxin RatB of RatAB toxin-antitoxin module|nr:RnfH family protein [Rhodanobacteraceae bacterium]